MQTTPTILQILPRLESGGVERGTLEIASAIQEQGMRAIVASAGGSLVPMLERIGAKHITLPLHSKNPLTIWRNISAIGKVIRDHQVNLVHARSRAPGWSAYYACKRENVPFLTTFHGIYGCQNAWKQWYNSVMVRGEKVIAVSEFVKQHVMEQYKVLASKVVRIDRGVDVKKFNPDTIAPGRLVELTKEWRLPDGVRNIILVPGRITRIKGQQVVLAALSKLQTKDFICVFLGNAEGHDQYIKELNEDIERFNLTGKVRLIPHTNYMAEAYALSDVVLMPSLKPEAFGRVGVEAQAMGKLIIASDHGGASETIVPDETGYLVQANNPIALTEAIDKALTRDAQTIQTMAKRAIEHTQNQYSITKMKQATIQVYRDILNRREARASMLQEDLKRA